MNRKIKADLALLFVTFTWGISYIMTKNTVEDIAVFNFLALRFIIAFIVSYLIFYKRMKKPDLYSIKYGLGVGLILFLGYAVQTIGIQYTTSSKSAFITGLNVIFVPLISAFIWKTKIKNMTKIGVIVSIIGLVLMTVNDLTGFNIGDVYTLFSAVAFALHIIYVGRYTLKTDSIQFAIAQIGAVGLFSALTSLVFEKPVLFFSIESWLNILFLAVLCTSAAFITQNIAQRYTTSTHTALIYINEPVFAAIAGYLVAGEVLGVRGTIGGLLMLSGIIIAELNFKMKLGTKNV